MIDHITNNIMNNITTINDGFNKYPLLYALIILLFISPIIGDDDFD
jgi:hypothetical protein